MTPCVPDGYGGCFGITPSHPGPYVSVTPSPVDLLPVTGAEILLLGVFGAVLFAAGMLLTIWSMNNEH